MQHHLFLLVATALVAKAHLPLALSLQVHHTHVHDGPQVRKGLHHRHVGALIVTVHVQLGKQQDALRMRYPETKLDAGRQANRHTNDFVNE